MSQSRRSRRVPGQFLLATIGIPIASLGVLFVLGLWFDLLGPGDALLGMALALLPFAIVVAGVRWVDRWEREPRWAVAFALLWGAGFCAIIGISVDFGATGPGSQLTVAVVQAPIVEEVAKALVLLILVVVARRQLDGPVDGIVYAAWTAAGFAFIENVLYFGAEFATGGDVPGLFLVRGLMSPFAHLMFSACVGIAVGAAVRRGRSFPGVALAWLLGLVPAIGLHLVWNVALVVVSDFLVYYLLVQLPLFAGMVWAVSWFRREERRITAARLSEFAAAGYLHLSEVDTLATREGRRRARQWASDSGRGAEMHAYIRTATRLAFAGQRSRTGGGAEEVEQALVAFEAARAEIRR